MTMTRMSEKFSYIYSREAVHNYRIYRREAVDIYGREAVDNYRMYRREAVDIYRREAVDNYRIFHTRRPRPRLSALPAGRRAADASLFIHTGT